MGAADVMARARALCAEPWGPGGFCRGCYLIALEAQIRADHPELDAAAVAAVVDEWLAATREKVH